MQKLKARLIRRSGSVRESHADPADDSPQGNAARGVKKFCESGGPNNTEDEVLHLPTIVDAAESSPLAAAEAANQIKKYLSAQNYSRPAVQYNAIMLIRILADNPGRTFTRSLDAKFVATVKDLLRQSRDPSVQQIMRETLDTFTKERDDDESLRPLTEMWLRERGPPGVAAPAGAGVPPAGESSRSQNYFARNHRSKSLPAPHELAGRIEEAKTSANLLLQVVQSTPSSEVLNNDLIAEFAQRCSSASRSVQAYIHSDDPVPDDDTLLTLIETNEQLSLAMSKHQRAVLQARKLVASRATPDESPAADEPREQDPFADNLAQQEHPSLRQQPPANHYPPPGAQDDLYDDDDAHAHRPAQHTPHFQEDPSRMPRRDESFRLTLPPQPAEPSGPHMDGDDPRWSWDQRASTQPGYGPQSGSAAPDRQGTAQDMRHPAYGQDAPMMAQRQQSAVKNTTMRGAAGPEYDVSPVSPVERANKNRH